MLDLTLVQQRLRDAAPALRLVGGSAAFDQAAATAPTAWPAAFVYPLSEAAGPNVLASEGVAQRVSVTFGVALCVQNVEDNTGDAALAHLRALRSEVLAALLGWALGSGGVLQFAGGRWMATHNGFYWWQDMFACDVLMRS